jgi:hypothetical protein
LSTHQRDRQRREIARRDNVGQRLIGLVGDHGAAFEGETGERQPVKIERDVAGDRGRLDAGHRVRSLEQPAREVEQLRIFKPASAQVIGAKYNTIDLEARIAVARFNKAAEKQSRDHQDEQCEGDLQPHQGFPNRAAAAGLRSGSQRLLCVQA